MGKNGNGWDFFEGSHSHLAISRNEMLQGSAPKRLLVVSCRCSNDCVVRSGRVRPIASTAIRAVESSQGVPSSVVISHFENCLFFSADQWLIFSPGDARRMDLIPFSSRGSAAVRDRTHRAESASAGLRPRSAAGEGNTSFAGAPRPRRVPGRIARSAHQSSRDGERGGNGHHGSGIAGAPGWLQAHRPHQRFLDLGLTLAISLVISCARTVSPREVRARCTR
jgi:hypothetical protein